MVTESRSLGFAFVVAVLSLAGALPRSLSSQTTIVRFAGIDPDARSAVLEKLRARPAASRERIFCVTRDTLRLTVSRTAGHVTGIDSTFLVLDVEPAQIDSIQAAGIQLLLCGNAVPWIRVRSSRDCAESAPCSDAEAAACAPTAPDYLDLLESRAPYAAIQCQNDELHFFFPAHFVDVSGSWSVERRPAFAGSPSRRARLDSGVFTLLLLGGVWVNGAFGIDRDLGGYRDTWTLDKYTHGLGAAVLTFSAMTAGVPRNQAALGICAAGIAFEASQGYVSTRDILADCGGALLAWGWQWVWAR